MNVKRNQGSKWVLLFVGLFLLMSVPAYAVVGNVTVLSGGDPVGQATITFQTPDGQVVAEEESDDDGKAALFIPDSHKGKSLIVIVTKGGSTARRTVAIRGDSVAVTVQLTGVAIVRDGFGYAVSVTGLYKWAQFDGSHNYSSSSGSGALNSSGPGVGANLHVLPPSNFLGGFPLSFVLGFGLPTNIDDDGARATYHPGSGNDTYLNVQENWFLRVLLAYELMAIRQCQLALLGGLQFTDVDTRMTTDETGGSGIVNNFSDSDFMASPVLGLGLSCPLNNTNMSLVANWYLTWMDDVSGSGTSTLSNNYRYKVDGGVQSELQFGIRIPLN
jgi:hypothetical protein